MGVFARQPVRQGGPRWLGSTDTGRFIGWLERALTFGLMVARQPEGVGFLLAAKSVLRIGDLKDPADRTHAEYIIIGTLAKAAELLQKSAPGREDSNACKWLSGSSVRTLPHDIACGSPADPHVIAVT